MKKRNDLESLELLGKTARVPAQYDLLRWRVSVSDARWRG